MIFNNITLKYKTKDNQHKEHPINFKNGLNIIISPDNGYGKTTISRLLAASTFKSTSIDLPKNNQHIISAKVDISNGRDNYEVFIILKNNKISAIETKKNNELINYSVFEDITINEIPRFKNTKTNTLEHLRPSWLLFYFLLDQDAVGYFDTKRLSSLNQMPLQVKPLIENWVLTGDVSSLELVDKQISLRLEYMLQLKKIQDIKAKISQNNTYFYSSDDIVKFESIQKQVNEKFLEKFTFQKQISEMSKKIFKLTKRKESPKRLEGKKNFYIDVMHEGKSIEVMVNVDDIFGFTSTKLKALANETDEKIVEINENIKKKKKDLKRINDFIETLVAQLPKNFVSEADTGVRANILSEIERDENEIQRKLYELNVNVEESKIKRREYLKNLRSKTKEIEDEKVVNFIGFIQDRGDTTSKESGSDIQLERISKFLAIHTKKLNLKNIPIIMDSLKEKDISSNALNKIISRLNAFQDSLVVEQTIVTFTTENKDFTSQGHLIELEKI